VLVNTWSPLTDLLSKIESKNIQIEILINYAGFGTYGAFVTILPETEQIEIAVNVSDVVGLAHAFIPGMLKRG
jgi:short-subunit dehydrogenase